MGVPISNVTRRVVYAASGTGPYNFTFEILANTDIAVYKDDTLLTLTTDYTVTINANGTGSITLTASPTGATQIAIVGNRTIQRTSDFVTGGDFFANTVNDELDQLTIFAQQNAEGLQRALTAPQTDPTSINMTLPRASLRAGKNLAFDANGNPTLGDTLGTNRGNWASGTLYYVRDIIKDTSNNNIWQCLTQHTSSGSQPISTNADSAKWTLLVDAASATTSASNAASSASAAATSASNASTSASNASSSASAASTSASNASTSATNAAASATTASTQASNASSSATAAAASAAAAASSLDSFDDRYLGSKASDPTLDNDGNALLTGALYYNTTTQTMKVYDGANWITATAAGTTAMLVYKYVATNGQTTFSGAASVGGTLSYTSGNIIVFVNGVSLDSTDYTATNGTSVVLASGAALNDEVVIVAFKSFTVADTYTKGEVDAFAVKLTGSQTVAGVKTFSSQPVMSAGVSLGSNGQIVFPATQNASSDVNTLDDYEEGTFTPTFLIGGSSGTVTTAVGYYRKIGSFVTAWVYMDGAQKGALTGNVEIGNLPFASLTGTDTRIEGAVGYFDGMASNQTFITPISGNGPATKFGLYGVGTGATTLTNLTNSSLSSSTNWRMVVFWHTA